MLNHRCWPTFHSGGWRYCLAAEPSIKLYFFLKAQLTFLHEIPWNISQIHRNRAKVGLTWPSVQVIYEGPRNFFLTNAVNCILNHKIWQWNVWTDQNHFLRAFPLWNELIISWMWAVIVSISSISFFSTIAIYEKKIVRTADFRSSTNNEPAVRICYRFPSTRLWSPPDHVSLLQAVPEKCGAFLPSSRRVPHGTVSSFPRH